MLKHMRPYLEESFPGIEIHLCFREENFRSPIVENEDENILTHIKMKEKKRSFAYVRELTCNFQEHPIESFLIESNLNPPILCEEENPQTRSYFISPKGNLPTKTMTDEQMKRAKVIAEQHGFHPTDDICGAGWVIGVENEDTYMSAFKGKKVSLVPNGIGHQFFSKLFPKVSLEKL